MLNSGNSIPSTLPHLSSKQLHFKIIDVTGEPGIKIKDVNKIKKNIGYSIVARDQRGELKMVWAASENREARQKWKRQTLSN